MITDIKLYFSSAQTLTDSTASDVVLNFASIAEVGRGSQLYINVFASDFTSAAEVFAIDLKTGSTTPGDNVVLGVIDSISAAVCSLGGQIAKVPLPSMDMEQYAHLYYTAVTAVSGKITAFLTLN